MAAAPHRMGPPPDDDDDDEPEVTRESIERERRARMEAERAASRTAMTRRSWYTRTTAADAFQAVVDDIHHATRTPKHEVVAALLEAAVKQSDRVRNKLSHSSHSSHE
ncbi:hypothetical protein [Streptomyces sp. rh34]|uniref:hypothetical protein n=1 Tax=Streptomyces sp. rh34 TaxID=2034272 RepID=UPI000BF1FF9E|nr:hypothetical protein [Streptomyces sp. rh34]